MRKTNRRFAVGFFVLMAMAMLVASASATLIGVSVDEFVDSRYPGITSPLNGPEGEYLWSGHQSFSYGSDVRAYTLMKFEDISLAAWDTLVFQTVFNTYKGENGTTKIWLNPNNEWDSQDVSYGNLQQLWDFENPLLLTEKYVPIPPNHVDQEFSFDLSSLKFFERSSSLSLVIGSVLPGENFCGDYWRDMINSNDDYSSSLVANPVPEPTTILLFGTGLVGLAGAARRKKQK